MDGEIIISDLSCCEPRECLTRKSRQSGSWMLLDYETDAGAGPHIKGVMIYGAGRLDSPVLKLPLHVKGWYKIYIATWHDIHMGGSFLRLKLEQDRYYRQLGPEVFRPKDGDFPDHQFGPTDLTEVFWRVAHLEEENLIIDRVRPWTYVTVTNKVSDPAGCLAYVRLMPAMPEEQDVYFGRGCTRKPRMQIAQYDNGNWWQMGCRTEDDIRASLDWFRGTDLTRINWGCYSNEGCCYPSQYGQRLAREPEVTRCIEEFFKRGLDPLQVASEYAREIGLGLYPSFRIGGKRPAPTQPTSNEMPFFDAHPHCLSVAADGTPTPHYSFAYEEVRAFFVNIVREVVANYELPGVHFIFARSQPFVLYEEKTVREFKEKYGLDPHELPENDERWQAHRAAYLTQFIRQLRQTLDEVGNAKGRRLELSVTVPSSPKTARDWAVDNISWAREGLVDYLILHAGGIVSIADLKVYVEPLGDTTVPLIVDFYPRRLPAGIRLRRAVEYYKAGADGFCFWDSEARVTRASEFAWGRFLGHHEDLEKWEREMEDPFRILPLKTLQGYSVDRRYWTLTSG